MLSDASFTSHSYDVYSPSGKGINIAELERREKEEADRRAQEEVDRKLKLIEERKKSLPKIDMTKKLDPPGASWYIYFLFFFSPRIASSCHLALGCSRYFLQEESGHC
jgi:hypothetical protein